MKVTVQVAYGGASVNRGHGTVLGKLLTTIRPLNLAAADASDGAYKPGLCDLVVFVVEEVIIALHVPLRLPLRSH